MRVLLVEDDDLIGDAIHASMNGSGYHADWVKNGLDAEDALATSEFDLVILDLGLPGQDGISVLRWLRKNHRSEPVIILTARSAVKHRIEGLDLGADDYMVKPFDMEELHARVRARIRRSHGRSEPDLIHGELCVDPAARSVRYKGEPVELSSQAYQVLVALLERTGRVISKDELAETLYGWDEGPESNIIEVYVSQIRKRIDPGLIRTIRGIGYVVDAE
ncbi:two-component system response regulator [Phaeobacter piscinae]|uniref:Two-component system response regulator n=1 Tax=Phaeobacter piscinae TaxID=1580596 RepID=A0AAN1GS86_9RHOB|nr:response regulator transcription factor [Phaeobacter piscinae]ATG44232.1 two-component system response regulator [Phaeobacter piscinae]AUR36542.1 two-component system response regulator [Phaeobacter piscinae]